MSIPRGGATVVTVDSKSTDISPATIHGVARGLITLRIAADTLSRGGATSPPVHVAADSTATPRFLPPEVARAALTVLLVKLLRSDPPPLPALPALVERSLAVEEHSRFGSIDFGSPSGLIHSICRLNGTDPEGIAFSSAEMGVLKSSSFVDVAIGAMLDVCSAPLVKVADAVAAVSCEAARADVGSTFNPRIPADGISVKVQKDKWDVAGCMNALLFGSKLVGQRQDLVPFEEVPSVHGRFRESVRSLHEHAKLELSTGSIFREKGRSDFMRAIEPFDSDLRDVGESSLSRAELIVESVEGDADLREKVAAIMKMKCPKKDSLIQKNLTVTFDDVYNLLVVVREVLAWEAALALFILEADESIEKKHLSNASTLKENNKAAKNEQKSERKEKKKTLGKGSSVIREFLLNKVVYCSERSVMDIANWAHELSIFFDPKNAELEALVTKIKEVTESNEAAGARRIPKTPKGTRDFGPEAMAIRERAFSIIVGVFKRHGARSIDTPDFELRETLMGKYGEDSKLIYDLADQGGELCSLRYDLTVPFARYLATNKLGSLTRYQIGKVHRRDNPSKGRFREFYQCDFDIAGQYELMDPDAEVIRVLTELLNELNIGSYEIKLNHRKLLDGMLEICGVPSNKFRTVCSSIDKLDKLSFEQVRKELVEEKGLTSNIADKIGSFVSKKGPPVEILAELKKEDSEFLQNGGAVCALDELEVLFRALEKSRCLSKIVFDLSLARGIDYYTGVIFEAVFKGVTQVGSIAAGGRYDDLVGMFSGRQIPAVGVSLGIERVLAIMEQMQKENNQVIRTAETQVLVAILENDVPLAHEVVSELWDAGINAEHAINKKPMYHISRAADSGIPWLVIVGESEVNNGIVKLKNINTKEEEKVPRDKMVEELRKRFGMS